MWVAGIFTYYLDNEFLFFYVYYHGALQEFVYVSMEKEAKWCSDEEEEVYKKKCRQRAIVNELQIKIPNGKISEFLYAFSCSCLKVNITILTVW